MRRPVIALVPLVVLALAACTTAAGQDLSAKSGGGSTRNITVYAPDGYTGAFPGATLPIKDFVDALAKRSNGTVTGSIDNSFAEGNTDDRESELVRAVMSGQAQAAVIPSRGLSAASLHALDALEAPFLIQSYDAERAVVESPVADQLLARLDGSGLHALALVAGPLRRPIMKDGALLGPNDWAGQRIRTQFSTMQDSAVKALGASPQHIRYEWDGAIDAGQLDGAEVDVNNVQDRGSVGYGYVLTGDVVLWPKIYVVVVNQQLWDGLTEAQQQAVSQAAVDARTASIEATWDESAPLRTLCTRGLRVASTTPAQRDALAAKVAPVTTKLEQNDPLYPKLRDIASAHPMQPLAVPTTCRSQVPASAVPTATPAPSGAPLPDFPDGAYRTTVREAEVFSVGNTNDMGATGTWTLEVSQGTYRLTCRSTTGSIHDCGNSGSMGEKPVEIGRITAFPDHYQFTTSAQMMSDAGICTLPPDPYQAPGRCYPDQTYRVGPVTRDDTSLTMRDFDGTALTQTIHSWQVIG